MTYSCGIFERPDSTLEEAALAKYDRICRKLELGPKDHVLEIGCGWGGFAIYAARRFGCRVTATTISRRQHELATQRVREAGLQEQVTVLQEDYRHLRGVYDKLVSVEMIEAVGDKYFDTYFRACCNLLKPDGMMLLQAITIADQSYEAYRRSVDFIQQYVFPGGLLPSVEAICRSVTRSTDFRLFHLEDITPHYARTLAHWRRAIPRQPGRDSPTGPARRAAAHLGVLLLLLRRRIPGTGDRRRPDAADQAPVPPGAHPSAAVRLSASTVLREGRLRPIQANVRPSSQCSSPKPKAPAPSTGRQPSRSRASS